MAEGMAWAEWQQQADVLFQRLLAMACVQDFGENFLDALEQYELLNPDTAEGHFFLSLCLQAQGQLELALAQAREAYRRRSQQPRIWVLLEEILQALGREREAYFYHVLSLALRKDDLFELEFPDQADKVLLQQEVFTKPNNVPLQVKFGQDSGEPRKYITHLAGQFMDSEYLAGGGQAGYREWCGIYNPKGWRGSRAIWAELSRYTAADTMWTCDFTFDIMKAQLASEIRVEPDPGTAVVVPVAGTGGKQRGRFIDESNQVKFFLPQYEFDFYRVETPTVIKSDTNMAIGEPILMRHDPGRLRLVLNIMTDGLSWKEMQKEDYCHVPNLRRFFAQGVTFANHYSVAEYTYPSLAIIHTGLHMHHSQVFHEKRYMKLAEEISTLAEKMKARGYYCIEALGECNGVGNDVARGFDRKILEGMNPHAHEGVDRALRYLEAFGETDTFMFLHMTDSHPYTNLVPMALQAEGRVPWQQAVEEENQTSVFLSGTPMSRASNGFNIEMMDRHLGTLFAYLQEHYAEDEYLVCLYSDHGASIYAEQPYLLSEEQAGAAFMLRGAGVPRLGDVAEMSSSLDILPAQARLLGLPAEPYWDGCVPAALGGTEREYVISNSLYPGQTYKLCLRTQEHEFRMETAEPTREDGTIDMHGYRCQLYTRDAEHRPVTDETLERKFMAWAWQHVHSFCHSLDE